MLCLSGLGFSFSTQRPPVGSIEHSFFVRNVALPNAMYACIVRRGAQQPSSRLRLRKRFEPRADAAYVAAKEVLALVDAFDFAIPVWMYLAYVGGHSIWSLVTSNGRFTAPLCKLYKRLSA